MWTNKRGLTILETMVGLSVGLVVMAAASATYLLYEGYMKRSSGQLVMEMRGRVGMERMAKALRSSYNASVSNAGGALRIVRDPNRTHSDSSDDITSEFRLEGTDLIYDPDITKSNDAYPLAKDVRPKYVDGLFKMAARRVIVAFKSYDSNTRTEVEFESAFKLRNN